MGLATQAIVDAGSHMLLRDTVDGIATLAQIEIKIAEDEEEEEEEGRVGDGDSEGTMSRLN